MKTIDEKLEKFYSHYQSTTPAKRKSPVLQNTIDSLSAEKSRLCASWAATHPNSASSLTALTRMNAYNDYDEIIALFNKLSDSLKQSPLGVLVNKRLEKYNTVALNATAPLFEQPDAQGKPVSLSLFRGKYVLVDFWASWCVPCRKENPALLKTWQTFKNKNFVVIGISLDKERAPWLAAIKADKLPWLQVSDLLWWKNTAAVLYHINGIPQNFLIDPNGKVIAKNLFGKKLDEKLTALL